jgi:hypothetical protein
MKDTKTSVSNYDLHSPHTEIKRLRRCLDDIKIEAYDKGVRWAHDAAWRGLSQEEDCTNELIYHTIFNIKTWHHDRNLIDGSTDKDQVCKLIQEVGELSDNVCKGQDMSDDIGDIMVVLINIAERNDLTITECLNIAYDDIKDRKGMMVDGIFVKEE